MRVRRQWLGPVLVLATGLLISLAGCQRERPEFLVAYSGDCQAYLDPCG